MENVNLHELSRKELKQLCNEHNIRTAGVKHDDLVRLLRNKLYPPASNPPRLAKARSQMSTDSQLSSKSTSEVSEKTPRRSISQGPSQRSLVFADDSSPDNTPERSTRELSPSAALPRKPVLTKSNSTPTQRSDVLRKKVNTLSGLGKQAQEKRSQQSDGSADKSRSNVGAQRPSIRNTSMAVKRAGDRPVVKINETQKSQTNADAYSEAASSPRASEGDASVTAVDSSDLGSHSFCSVSEIATDAGHHVMSEDSDNDDGRSVSSEPASRFTCQINKLTPRRSTGSKLRRGVYSSGDSEQGGDSLHSSARNNGVREQHSHLLAPRDGEEIFPYFLEDVDSLVGDTGGLDSFLDAPIADPEDVNRAEGHQVDFEQFRTSEISTPRYQDDDIIDREGSMREEVAIICNNEAATAADHPEFELGNYLLVNYENTPISERAGVVHTTAAVLPSTPEARTEILNPEIRKDSVLSEKPHAVVNADIDIAPQFPQNPNHSSDYESAKASFSFPDPGRSAERLEEVSDSTPEILNGPLIEAVEFPEHPPIHVEINEPENLSGVKSTHDPCDSLSPSGEEKLGEASAVSSDPVHMEEQAVESRGLGIECNKVFEDGAADERSPMNHGDLTEMLTIAREASELNHAASPHRLLADGNNDDSCKQVYSPVVLTTARSDFENPNHGNFEDGNHVRDASDCIQHAKLAPLEPDKNRSDVKWSFVSALYDNLQDVQDIVDSDGYDLLERMLADAGEACNNSTEDFEPLKHLSGPESETGNRVEPAAIEDEAKETVEVHDLLRSGADDDSGANSSVSAEGKSSRSLTLVQDTFEGLRDENTSETTTEMEEETETWSAFEEDPGVPIQTRTLAGEIESSTGLKEHESRLPSSGDEDGVLLHGDQQSLGLQHLPDLVPDKLEKTSHDNTAASSHPRKMGQILSAGLKAIFVIGSITFGILKFRASRHRFR